MSHFKGVLSRTFARGGAVVIPAFTLDRTEAVLHELAGLRRAGLLPVEAGGLGPEPFHAVRSIQESVEHRTAPAQR